MKSNAKVSGSISLCPILEEKPPGESKPREKSSNVSIKCTHRDCPSISHLKVFELVPISKKEDILTIRWDGNDPSPPAFLETSEGEKIYGPPYVIKINNENNPELFPKKYETNEKLGFNSATLDNINTYGLKRKLKVKGMPFGNFDVLLYNPDQWKLEINFPLPTRRGEKKGIKYEKEYNTEISKTTTDLRSEGRNVLTTEITEEESANPRWRLKTETVTLQSGNVSEVETHREYNSKSGTLRYVPDEKTVMKATPDTIIRLYRNGDLCEVDAENIFRFICILMRGIQNISKILKDIPKAGAYFEYEYSALSDSTISLEWGWKEYTDHRAFFGVKGKVQLTLFDCAIELGIGVSGFAVKFQAFIKFAGKIEVVGSYEKKRPLDEDKRPEEGSGEVNVEGSIAGSVGARCQVGFFVKLEATLTSSLDTTGRLMFLTETELFKADLTVSISGLKGRVVSSIGYADALGEEQSTNASKELDPFYKRPFDVESKSEGKEVIFIEAFQLGQYKFPSPEKDFDVSADEMSDADIQISIKEMLNGYYLNSGFWSARKIIVKKFMDMDEYNELGEFEKFVKHGLLDNDPLKDADQDKVVERIFKKIEKEEFFDRHKHQVQLFLLKTRELLEILMQKDDRTISYIKWSDFKDFINGNEFHNLIKSNQDSAKAFYEKNIA